MNNKFLDFFSGHEEPKTGTKQDSKDKRLVVNKSRCPQNHPCPAVKVCAVDALSQKGFLAPTVNMSMCIGCGKCVKFCPMRALSLE